MPPIPASEKDARTKNAPAPSSVVAKPTRAKNAPATPPKPTVADLRLIRIGSLRAMVREQAPNALKGRPSIINWKKDELIFALTNDPDLKRSITTARRNATRARNAALRAEAGE